MAKIDLGAIDSMVYVSGQLTDTTGDIGTLPAGKWACVPIYPLNFDLTCEPNSNNHVIVGAISYRGLVVIGCYPLT